MKNNSPEQILSALKQSKRTVCFLDSRLDFDTVCAAITLKKLLKKELNKNLDIFYEDDIPDSFSGIIRDYFDTTMINVSVNPKTFDFSRYDTLVFLDTGNEKHIVSTEDFAAPKHICKINIDHHNKNSFFGTINYVKCLGATCTVLFSLTKKWKFKINRKLANILLLGITTDNGFFQYNTTTSTDFRTAAELVDLGADYYNIVWKLSFNTTIDDIRLRKVLYANFKADFKNKFAYSTISFEDIKRNKIVIRNTTTRHSDYLKKLNGVNFVFVIEELPPEAAISPKAKKQKSFRISFRSHHNKYDVSKLAKMFGGGGHKMAAGAVIKAKSVEEVKKILFDKIKSQ